MYKFFYIILLQFILLTHLTSDDTFKDGSHKCVLVVGGAGFIGSHVNKLLIQQNYKTIVLDNLCRGKRENVVGGVFIEGDLADNELLDSIFKEYSIDVVMHFAAFTDVGESCRHPELYYNNNVRNTVNLLEAMVRNQVPYIIFSSSAAIFGDAQGTPINEDCPCRPLSPYGHSKLMVEQILHDFSQAYPLKYCALRYFNAVGGDPEGIIKNYKDKESNLVPMALKNLKAGLPVKVFGSDYPTKDGTCIRDYIHIYDLGSAHILAMERLLAGYDSAEYNLGNGFGFSVLEILEMIKKVTGQSLDIILTDRRPGDGCYLVADANKAKRELGWQPRYTLEMMIKDAWQALTY